MRLILFYFLFICTYSFSQTTIELGGKIGFGYLVTSSSDNFFALTSRKKERLYSSPSIVGGIFSTANYQLSDVFTPTIGLSVHTEKYNYRVNDYLDQDFIKATFTRLQASLSIGMRSFIFVKQTVDSKKKVGKSKRKRDSDSKLLPYLITEYNLGIKIQDFYKFAGDKISPATNLERNNLLHGFGIGFGFQKSKFHLSFIHHFKFTNLLNEQEDRFNLKSFHIGCSYRIVRFQKRQKTLD